MKHVLLLLGSNIQLSPYIHKYINLIKKNECRIVLLYWDRGNITDDEMEGGLEIIRYRKKIDNDIFPVKKIPSFLAYKKKIESILNERKWDLIIVFTTPLSILIGGLLQKKYPRKYIIDYRDPTILERFWIFRRRLKKTIQHSLITSISSKAYGFYLPYKDKLIVNHNYIEGCVKTAKRENRSDKIRIAFWGCVRDYEANTQFLEKLKNDKRFEINYYGTYDIEGQRIKQFCKNSHISNVTFHGKYQLEDRGEIAVQTDLIHNVYSNKEKGGNPSMGNKFYDGILFKVPQICLRGGFMGKMAEQYQVGITIDFQEDFPNQIYQYYKNLDKDKFAHKCEVCLMDILNEEKLFEDKIEGFLSGESATL